MTPRCLPTILAIALTLAVHGVLWWLLQSPPAPTARPTVAARLTTLVLLPWPRAAPPAEPDPPPTRAADAPTRPTPAPKPAATAAAFAPITRPATAAVSVATVLPAEPAASEPATPPGLTLALPRTRAGQPGAPRTLLGDSLAEQRQLAPGGSFSERMSRALGTVQARVEEPLNGDSIRLRQGNDCVVVSRSRESQLDPFNQSVNPSARGVTPCR